ncbi:uncharacterized protein LOC114174447 [Vigna unguiculata]|uniref:uncharacterized protein LOC114174447 n=1 Tax=Vigna unguiculata TaxID=3917 RepID=UPI0010165C78|nr:uncharacterized protein LOC114174447 [Vigna unguiculata]
MPPIVFIDDDFHGLDHQQDDPIVITVEIENYAVKKVLVDQGSSVDILYWATYQKLQLPDTAMVPYDEPIYGFSSEQVSTQGYIDLHTVFQEGTQTKTIPIRFLIVDAPTSYNILLGRPSLNTLDVVVSTPHLAMKFPAPSDDILTTHYDQRLAREFYMASLRPQLLIQQTNHIERPPCSSKALSGEDHDPRIGRDVRLEPIEDTSPLELSNDYTDLNKACPRDTYPLHNIDRLVDGAAGNKVLTFLDAYFGYSQIPMAASDMHKTAFITDDANYFYKVMPFGLKNAGATYQRLMDKVFSHLMGHCVEVYVDDMVVKSPSHRQHAEDLSAVFSTLRQYNLRLNPDKCVFDVDRATDYTVSVVLVQEIEGTTSSVFCEQNVARS